MAIRAEIRGMYRIEKYGQLAPYYVADCLLRDCDWSHSERLRNETTAQADHHARSHLKAVSS